MANELSFTLGALLSNGNLVDSIPTFINRITQTNAELLNKTVSVVHTAEADLDTTGITTLGYVYLRNVSTVNFVKYGPKSGGVMVALGRLNPGEWALIRLEPGITLRWIADTATVKLQVRLYGN